jgi:hypothetical protein
MEIAAEKLGIPMGTIKARSSREKWFEALKKEEATMQPLVATPSPSEQKATELSEKATLMSQAGQHVVEIVQESLAEIRESSRHIAGRASRKGLRFLEGQDAAKIVAQSSNLKNLVDANAKATGYDDEVKGGNVLVSLNFLADVDPAKVVDGVAVE